MSLLDSSQNLSTFRLPPLYRERLASAGFQTLQDLQGLGPVELAMECPGLSQTDALKILTTVKNDLNERNPQQPRAPVPNGLIEDMNKDQQDHPEQWVIQRSSTIATEPQTALTKLQSLSRFPSIVTFCEELDNILGGGVAIGKMTEFCGLPGVGKTQLGIQIAVDTFIPPQFGGCGGHAIYIDTEGSFVPERAMEIAGSVVSHLNLMMEEDATLPQSGTISTDTIAENLQYYRVNNYIEQLALIGQLGCIVSDLNSKIAAKSNSSSNPASVQIEPAIRCIVLDSVTFHFRATEQFPDAGVRSRLLTKMSSELTSLASYYNLAVVVINQMTTKPGHGVVPALGDIWGHQATTRVVLEMDLDCEQRKATVIKSSNLAQSSAFYVITQNGIRSSGVPQQT